MSDLNNEDISKMGSFELGPYSNAIIDGLYEGQEDPEHIKTTLRSLGPVLDRLIDIGTVDSLLGAYDISVCQASFHEEYSDINSGKGAQDQIKKILNGFLKLGTIKGLLLACRKFDCGDDLQSHLDRDKVIADFIHSQARLYDQDGEPMYDQLKGLIELQGTRTYNNCYNPPAS